MIDQSTYLSIKLEDIPEDMLIELKKSPASQLDFIHMKEKLELLESNIKTISYVKARNGIKEKKDRPMNEVVSELHESIYWQKPFGLLVMSIYDFAVAHKITSTFVALAIWLFHNPIVECVKTILDGPGQWIIPLFGIK